MSPLRVTVSLIAFDVSAKAFPGTLRLRGRLQLLARHGRPNRGGCARPAVVGQGRHFQTLQPHRLTSFSDPRFHRRTSASVELRNKTILGNAWPTQGREIRYRFLCTVVFTYAKCVESLPGMSSPRVINWAPGNAPALERSIPPGGSSGRVSPCPTGIARLFPGLIRDGASIGITRNAPVDDHFGTQ